MEHRICAVSHRPFTISDGDIAMLEKFGVPLPTLRPEERMRRLSRTLPRTMFDSTSAKTGKPILTPFDPARGLTVWGREEFDRTLNA